MSSHSYFGIKDAGFSYGFSEAQWLTPYETMNTLNLNDLNSIRIYPHELVNNDSKLCDIILLGKYRNKYGNLKLKSVLLSQLASAADTNDRLHILSLPKESYYWCKVENSLIPKFALRAGYDSIAKQFSYIGRMKVSSLFNHSTINLTNSTATTNLIGSLTHIYEYIPAIVLQLHDLSFLDENLLINLSNTLHNDDNRQTQSFWTRLRTAIKNKNSQDMDFNFISTNYEVLCLKKQPASLKQLCILKLNNINEEFMQNESNSRRDYLDIFKSLNTLPNSIRNLLWPSLLGPGQCIVKNGKMRSLNGVFEIYLSPQGSIKFSKQILNDYVNAYREVTTYEKNVESFLVSQSGVFLIYDNHQPMRKPTVLYKHVVLFNDCLKTSFSLDLNDNGFLRVLLTVANRKTVINIINLNDFFKPIGLLLSTPQIAANLVSSKNSKQSTIDLDNLKRSVCVNVKLALIDILSLVELPLKLIKFLMPFLYSIIQNLTNRLRQAQQI